MSGEAPDRHRRVGQATVFFGALALVFAAYTVLAMQLDWQTQAGRIGAGFLPRIVGVVALVLCTAVTLWTLRSGATGARTDGDAEASEPPGSYLRVVVWMTVAGIAFVALLVPLGALIATALFVFGALWALDRGHLARAALIGVSTSVLLYLLLEVALHAGLPKGVLFML